ncbi:hypothetical protein IAQ61_003941 [Plenodomus lingam]|uniref:Predicted protein n=1 Tax=Leptosphaeria maculans (strain JN3 / isolate v23.1.3 / race Av1-4-5-6-7-8) TaxID=985895 RepID=E4ZQR3_LEPMJ|nr:predicted protein [Plenodomus lingam JN3]KAH9874751.1 hypothetical protein IAQ61_003941 [Plenodomus lingam]CBX94068.1 predicted protein [Plenodomus lingam JN3]
MAKLTYERLLVRLDSLWVDLPARFPHPDDAARLHEVQRAIAAGQHSARRGVEGKAHKVLSPGRLKQWVNDKVAKIHEHYDQQGLMHEGDGMIAESNSGEDGPDDMEDVIESIETDSPHTDSGTENGIKRESPVDQPMPPAAAPAKVSAVNKCIVRGRNAYAGVKKTAPKLPRTTAAKPRLVSPKASGPFISSFSDHEAAIALLQLFEASPAIGHERPAATGLPATRRNVEAAIATYTTPKIHPSIPTYTPPTTRDAALTSTPPKYPVAAPSFTSLTNPAPVSTVTSVTSAASVPSYHQLDIPAGAYDVGASPRSIFLAGVKYAMDNYDSVKGQMNGHGQTNGQFQTAGRGFWDVI